ncbi:MAG: hypothetical protein ACE3L7_04140 [Candidatus Pristimantibacillus sp.]
MDDVTVKSGEVVKPTPQVRKAAKLQPPQTLIYVGPNLQGGVLAKYTTFRGEIPIHIESLKDKYAGLVTLIVPIDDLQTAQRLTAKEGTSQYKAYQSLLKGGN